MTPLRARLLVQVLLYLSAGDCRRVRHTSISSLSYRSSDATLKQRAENATSLLAESQGDRAPDDDDADVATEVTLAKSKDTAGFDIFNTLQMAACLFAVAVVIYFAATFYMDIPSSSSLAALRVTLDRKCSEYEDAVSKLAGRGAEFAAGEGYLKERLFQERREHLVDFLEAVITTSGPHLEGLEAPLRGLVLLWLSVYEQIAIDPEEVDNQQLVGLIEEQKAETLVAMRASFEMMPSAVEIAKHAKGLIDPVDFLTTDLAGVRTFQSLEGEKGIRNGRWVHGKFGCSCGGPRQGDALFPAGINLLCVEVNIYSWQHIIQLVGFFFGLALLTVLQLWGYFVAGIMADFATILLLVLLCLVGNNHVMENLQASIKKVEDDTAKVHVLRKKIGAQHQRMERLLSLWQHRTQPSLDLLAEVLELITDRLLRPSLQEQQRRTSQGHQLLLERLGNVIGRLQLLHQGLGQNNYWFGESALPEQNLAAAGEQVTALTSFIAEHRNKDAVLPLVLEYIDRPSGWLTVDVRACTDLLGVGMKLPQAYVVVRVGDESGKTRVVENEIHPRWGLEGTDVESLFHIDSKHNVSEFTLELYDARTPEMEERGTPIAFAQVRFLEQPGRVHRRRQQLLSGKTKKPGAHGSIEFNFQFVTSVQQWAAVRVRDTERMQGQPSNLSVSNFSGKLSNGSFTDGSPTRMPKSPDRSPIRSGSDPWPATGRLQPKSPSPKPTASKKDIIVEEPRAAAAGGKAKAAPKKQLVRTLTNFLTDELADPDELIEEEIIGPNGPEQPFRQTSSGSMQAPLSRNISTSSMPAKGSKKIIIEEPGSASFSAAGYSYRATGANSPQRKGSPKTSAKAGSAATAAGAKKAPPSKAPTLRSLNSFLDS